MEIFNISETTKRRFRPSTVGGGGGSLPQLSPIFNKGAFNPTGPDSHSYS